MSTQIQPTPIVTGEAAKKIEELIKIKPTYETEIGKQILQKMFEDVVECDGRCLNCDHFDTEECPDRK